MVCEKKKKKWKNKRDEEWRNLRNSGKTDKKEWRNLFLVQMNNSCEQMERNCDTFSIFRIRNTQNKCLAHCLTYWKQIIF